jgi:hypothetical protein
VGSGAPGVGKGPKGPHEGAPGKGVKAGTPGGNAAAGDETGDKGKPGLPEREAQFAKRVEKLKARAEELRKQGKIKAAEGLQKQAERLEQRGVNGPDPAKSAANREKIRKARKLARVKLLHRRYGEELSSEVVRQEVELHARRSANLSRIKSLASAHEDGEKKQGLLKRINRLMAKENARHSRSMAKLAKPQKKPATMVDTKKSASAGEGKAAKEKAAKEKANKEGQK